MSKSIALNGFEGKAVLVSRDNNEKTLTFSIEKGDVVPDEQHYRDLLKSFLDYAPRGSDARKTGDVLHLW